MTNLYLVRHAHSVYTLDELTRPLSEQGLNDAKTITDTLKAMKIDVVISSPYKRAIQTVEGIAAYISGAILIEDDFKERLLSGQPVEDFQAAIEKVWEDSSFAWEGGESNVIAQKRGAEAVMQVLKKHPNKNIVIGTHGNLLALILNSFDQSYGFDFWKQLDMPDIYRLAFDGAGLKSVSRVWSRINQPR
ncbi:histidine phosphatase family protein [Paenibacillus sp. LHD-38]|uniref:histidine phosphatase family protein n=1 Tax=Paenibacillus sp. LHD-38 TaxID=3072143 RepID=UPI00280D71BF|nr:histidine phosphatase family protein [Paenibacillus sp. LHD-38]MDQ8735877.1 histidine phosphatase family protein [Paenibacillus sp. LHD-38]